MYQDLFLFEEISPLFLFFSALLYKAHSGERWNFELCNENCPIVSLRQEAGDNGRSNWNFFEDLPREIFEEMDVNMSISKPVSSIPLSCLTLPNAVESENRRSGRDFELEVG